MTLEEWQELVSLYGDFAYLMCFFEITPLCGVTAGCNDGIIQWFANPDYTQLKKKKSAALNFDKAAALAGDEVQYIDVFGKYHDVIFCGVKVDKLRMKHPRRVGVDYSQFEEK